METEKQVVVFDLGGDVEQHFSGVTPEHAVRYCYAEENRLLSLFFSLQDRSDKQEQLQKHFPLTRGLSGRTLACGNFCCHLGNLKEDIC